MLQCIQTQQIIHLRLLFFKIIVIILIDTFSLSQYAFQQNRRPKLLLNVNKFCRTLSVARFGCKSTIAVWFTWMHRCETRDGFFLFFFYRSALVALPLDIKQHTTYIPSNFSILINAFKSIVKRIFGYVRLLFLSIEPHPTDEMCLNLLHD